MRHGRPLLVVLGVSLFSLSSHVFAADWLIARVNGQWAWERTGAQGRISKSLPNQEVLRLAEDGSVSVITSPPLVVGDRLTCSDRARRDVRNRCSSAFLDCRSDPGGFLSTVSGLLGSGPQAGFDARNSYRCELNENALLEAAQAVGMIEKVPPQQ